MQGDADRIEVSRGHSNREVKDQINGSLEYNRGKKERLMRAENFENKGCLQMNSAEHEEYAKA